MTEIRRDTPAPGKGYRVRNLKSGVTTAYTNVDVTASDSVIIEPAASEPEPPPPSGDILYVSPNGSDTNNGSIDHPLKTPQKAVDLSSGETVYLASGTYPGVEIGKALKIMGEGTLDGSIGGRKSVLHSTGNGVVIEGISVVRAIGSGNAADGPACIRVDGGSARILSVRISDAGTGTFPLSSNDKGACASGGCRRGGFGVLVKSAVVEVLGCDVSRAGSGVRLIGSTGGSSVKRNRLHHNDRLLNHGSSDTGAQGVAVRDKPHDGKLVLIEENLITDSIAHSPEFGGDGGGVELYNAADVVIRRNRMKDVRVGSECGGGSGWSGQIGWYVIEYNELWRTPTGAQGCENVSGIKPEFFQRMAGFNFRNGVNSVYRHNSGYLLNLWGMFTIEHGGGGFGGSIAGSKVVDNAAKDCSQLVSINSAPTDFVFDYNAHNPEKNWASGHSSLASWQSATRYDDHSLEVDPRFVQLGTDPDFTLQTGSPLIGEASDGGNIGAR